MGVSTDVQTAICTWSKWLAGTLCSPSLQLFIYSAISKCLSSAADVPTAAPFRFPLQPQAQLPDFFMWDNSDPQEGLLFLVGATWPTLPDSPTGLNDQGTIVPWKWPSCKDGWELEFVHPSGAISLRLPEFQTGLSSKCPRW